MGDRIVGSADVLTNSSKLYVVCIYGEKGVVERLDCGLDIPRTGQSTAIHTHTHHICHENGHSPAELGIRSLSVARKGYNAIQYHVRARK